MEIFSVFTLKFKLGLITHIYKFHYLLILKNDRNGIFWRSYDYTTWNILIIKATRCTNFLKFYFWNETTQVSDNSYVHHQEFLTVHTAMVYVLQVCWQLASRIRIERVQSWSWSKAVYKSVWHIPLLCVQWKTPDDGQTNCPKPVEFHCKIKFEEIIATSWFYYKYLSRCTVTWTSYHDARSRGSLITMHGHMD